MYHVPKQKAGIELQGMSGEVVEDVSVFEGKTLSPSTPLRCKFENPDTGKPFFVHLAEDEVEAA